MNFNKALYFYKDKLKFILQNNKLSLCKVDLLFRNYIIKKQKDINSEFALKSYLSYILLAIYSICNIFRLKFKHIVQAHYLIDINNNSGSFYDNRSSWIVDIVDTKQTINFMHINNIKYSLKTLLKKDNVIYFEAIYYLLKPFLKKQRYEYIKSDDKFISNLLEINQVYYSDSYYLYNINKIILKFLNIKNFIMLDDSRYTNELKLACNDLDIQTIGYMHGRFNEYHLGLFEFPFDTYIVWSEYFKNKLLEYDSYKDKNIVVVGNSKITEKFEFIQRDQSILWLGESNVNYEEIFCYIKNIKALGYNIIFRGKPGFNATIDNFLEENAIQKDSSKSYFESLEENEIALVMATYSTTLMESWLLGIPSIALECRYDYGSHLWEDGLVDLADKNNLKDAIDRNMNLTNDNIKNRLCKIWGEDYLYNRTKVIEILQNNRSIQ